MSTIPFPTKEEIEKINLFFIIGRPRSGTTLLRTLLDAHPNVVVPTESPFTLLLARRYGKITFWTEERIIQFVKDIQLIWLFRTLKIDISILRANLMTLIGKTDYITICKAVMLNFNSIFPKNNILIIGDKNPPYSVMFRDLFRIFGTQCKYIHLVRDYRDVHYSLLSMNFDFHYPAVTALRWKKSYKQIDRIKRIHRSNFHTLTYESLVLNPETELMKTCSFLDIPYDPEILNFHLKRNEFNQLFSETSMKNLHKGLLNPIKPDKIGFYKNRLRTSQVKICDMITGKTAENAGYRRDYKCFSLATYLQAFPGIILFYLVINLTKIITKLNFNIYIRISGRPLISVIWNKFI